MYCVNHSVAIELEWIVRGVYKCDRSGISGMADADYLEHRPIQAAVLIIAYAYALGRVSSPYEYDEFLCKYESVFENPGDYDINEEVKNYLSSLRVIVESL